jgi:hypothetical protein
MCLCRGTRILTSEGEVAVERLKVGDLVTTVAGVARPVTWIGWGRSLVTAANPQARPIIVRRDAIADGVPTRDLHVTKAHSLYLDGVLIPAEFLVNGYSIVEDSAAQVIEFYHIELPSHDVLFADGAPAESYKEDGNRDQFHNTDRPVVAAQEAEWFAPVHIDGPVMEAAWRRLMARSEFQCPKLTTDPDLHVIADGQRVDAEHAEDGVYRFRLERAPDELRIVSRSASPAELGRNPDWRRLGVAIRSIVLRRADETRNLPHDWLGLSEGFHGAEAWGARWTDGDAQLPNIVFCGLAGSFELLLTIGGDMQYPVAESSKTDLHRAA